MAGGFAAQLGGVLQGEGAEEAASGFAMKIASGEKITQDDLRKLAEDNPYAVALMPDGLLALAEPLPAPQQQGASQVAATGLAEGAAPASALTGDGGKVPGLAGGTPLPSAAGEEPVPPLADGEPVAGSGVAGSRGAGQPDSGAAPNLQGPAVDAPDLAPEAPRTALASRPEQSVTAGEPQASPQPSEAAARRWRSELPQELRAQGNASPGGLSASKSAGERVAETVLNVEPGSRGAAPATSGGGAAEPAAISALKAGTPQGEGILTATRADVEAGNGEPGKGRSAAAGDGASGPAAAARATLKEMAPASMSADEPVAGTKAVDAAMSSAGAGAVAKSAGGGPGKAAAAPEGTVADTVAAEISSGLPVEESALADDVAGGDEVLSGKVSAEGRQKGPGEGRPDAAADRPVAANVADRTTADGPAPRGAAPVAAAALSTQFVEGDTDSMDASGDWTLTSDAAASTVRGGQANGAMRTESHQMPNQAQSGHVATQVAAEIARNLKDGNTRFQMRFDPPELGRVEVKMKVSSDGTVHAHLVVDRPETLDMFLRDQRGLERALEAAGLNTDSSNLQFSLKQDSGQQFGSGQGQSDPFFGDADRSGSDDTAADPVAEEVVRLTLARQRGGLDMKV